MSPETRIAWRGVTRRKKVLLFVVLALAIGATLVIVMEGMFISLTEALHKTAVTVFYGDIVILPHEKTYMENAGNKVMKIKSLEAVDAASQRIEVQGLSAAQKKEEAVSLNGIVPSEDKKITELDTKIVDGSYLADTDRDKILIGSELANALDVKVNDEVYVSAESAARKYKVKGIFTIGAFDLDRRGVFLTYDEMESLIGKSDIASKILIKLKSGYEPKSYLSEIAALGISDDIKDSSEFAAGIEKTLAAFSTVFRILSYMALLVSAIMVGIVIYLNIISNIRLIGTLKAIGTRESKLLKLFLIQALIYSVAGGIAGIFLGYVASLYFHTYPVIVPITNIIITAEFSLPIAVRGVAVTVLAAVLAAIYPAHRASKTNIVEAMRVG